MKKRLLMWLLESVRRVFAWNTRILVRLMLWRAGVFRRRGEWEKAAKEMSSVVGLEAADFENPAQALAKIHHRLADVDPETAIVFFMQLSTFLVDDKKQDWVAAVHELDAGLHPGNYADLGLIASRLRERTQALPSMLRFFYEIRLANVLGLAERSRDELAVLESVFGLRQKDYQDPVRLRSAFEARPDIPPDLWAMAIPMLAAALGKMGRRTESVFVLEAALGLSAVDYTDLAAIRSKIMAAIGPLESRIGSVLGYLSLLAKGLQDLGRLSESISLYEADLDLDSVDYRNVSRLGAKIRARRAWLPPEMAAFSVVQFLSALIGAQRFEDALAVLGADLGIDLTQIDAQSLVARLRSRCESLPDNMTGFYLGVAAFTLATADRPLEAVTVLATDSDLEAIDWRDTTALAVRLESRLGDLAASTRLLYVGFLASALQIAGQDKRAALLTDAYLRYVSPIGKEPADPGLMAMSCHLYTDWLDWWGRNVERSPLEVCRNLVPYLRQTLAEQGVTLVDRERFIRDVSNLRHRIVQTGLYWAEQEIDSLQSLSAHEFRRDVFLWDLELSQRLLVERFLLAEIHPASAGEPVPTGVWPLSEVRPTTKSYLPGFLEVPAMTGILGGMSTPQAPSPSEEAPVRFPFASRLEDLAHRGLDEAAVAGSLGENGLLLRVTFDPEGRLVWGGLRSNGPRLDLAGFGTGVPGDLQLLRWATARHDFSMSLLHWMTDVQPLFPLRSAAQEALLSALRCLTESVEPGARVAEVIETLSSGVLPEAASASLCRLLQILVWPLAEEGSDPIALQELRATERFVAEIDQQPQGRNALDAMTADYLRHVAEIWDLSSLDAFLTPDTDLVVQGDDALHAVPVAWLPRGGEPLYRRVRTVRASLAPQLDALLEEIDRDGSADPDERRLLSISYFGPEDLAREGARWLHHGHLRLAERFGAVSVAGADEKTGTVGSIRAALEEHGSFATVAICGHGDFEQAGIQLGGEGGEKILWQGQGCDLSRVDWLLLVSCSIGRASRTGDLDVEGFCVQLAVHRARSVLACRWPVLAVEAAAFANEAVRQYLELEGQPERRARALTAARHAVCEGERPLVGLNTAAAFELYGLG